MDPTVKPWGIGWRGQCNTAPRVIAGLVPAIQRSTEQRPLWIPGTSPGINLPAPDLIRGPQRPTPALSTHCDVRRWTPRLNRGESRVARPGVGPHGQAMGSRSGEGNATPPPPTRRGAFSVSASPRRQQATSVRLDDGPIPSTYLIKNSTGATSSMTSPLISEGGGGRGWARSISASASASSAETPELSTMRRAST